MSVHLSVWDVCITFTELSLFCKQNATTRELYLKLGRVVKHDDFWCCILLCQYICKLMNINELICI